MAAVHGKLTDVRIDDVGGTLRDISNQVRNSALKISAQEIDVTAYQDSARKYIADFQDGTFTISGNASATVMGYLYGIVGQAAGSVQYGPEGTATGKRKYTFEAVCIDIDDSGASTGKANEFSATFRVDGAVTVGTY